VQYIRFFYYIDDRYAQHPEASGRAAAELSSPFSLLYNGPPVYTAAFFFFSSFGGVVLSKKRCVEKGKHDHALKIF
jgi:hypothetical protein